MRGSRSPSRATGLLGGLVLALAGLTSCGAEDAEWASLTQAVRVCPRPATVEGIDVSQYQGTIDWAAVKASGIEFDKNASHDFGGELAVSGDGKFFVAGNAQWVAVASAGRVEVYDRDTAATATSFRFRQMFGGERQLSIPRHRRRLTQLAGNHL